MDCQNNPLPDTSRIRFESPWSLCQSGTMGCLPTGSMYSTRLSCTARESRCHIRNCRGGSVASSWVCCSCGAVRNEGIADGLEGVAAVIATLSQQLNRTLNDSMRGLV